MNKLMEKQVNILYVDDEEVNYLYIDTLLEDFELKLKMPVMNGFEATKLIKEFRPDLPIVAQTAYSTKADKEKALNAGCDDFISKPISEKTLNKTINKYLYT